MKFMAIMVALIIGFFVLNGNAQEKNSADKQAAFNSGDPSVPAAETSNTETQGGLTAPGTGCKECAQRIACSQTKGERPAACNLTDNTNPKELAKKQGKGASGVKEDN